MAIETIAEYPESTVLRAGEVLSIAEVPVGTIELTDSIYRNNMVWAVEQVDKTRSRQVTVTLWRAGLRIDYRLKLTMNPEATMCKVTERFVTPKHYAQVRPARA